VGASGSAVDTIATATATAAESGHILAGFRRCCNSAGYQFTARCRRCGAEVTVHRGTDGWGFDTVPACTQRSAWRTRSPGRRSGGGGQPRHHREGSRVIQSTTVIQAAATTP
jgi:hypothetical protein